MAGLYGIHAVNISLCHSLMLVLLNGGWYLIVPTSQAWVVPLADACVTEWRLKSHTLHLSPERSATR